MKALEWGCQGWGNSITHNCLLGPPWGGRRHWSFPSSHVETWSCLIVISSSRAQVCFRVTQRNSWRLSPGIFSKHSRHNCGCQAGRGPRDDTATAAAPIPFLALDRVCRPTLDTLGCQAKHW